MQIASGAAQKETGDNGQRPTAFDLASAAAEKKVMRITEVQVSEGPGGHQLSASVHANSMSQPMRVWFRSEDAPAPLRATGDSFAAGLLLPCMFEAEDLYIDAPVSAKLLAALHRAQEMFATWHSYLTPIEVKASGVYESAVPRHGVDGVGCFFSGGVDSWYSLLKHEKDVTHLLLVRGFDIGNDNDALWEETTRRAQRVADTMEKRLLTIATNLRDVADKRRCSWGRRHNGDFWGQALHGAALAAVGLTTQHVLGRLIIGATHTYRLLTGWGSHPMLDPLWSTERLTFEHDGCEADRVSKIKRVAHSQLALDNLRVCYMNTNAVNCCRCEKCLRTMMTLQLSGALDRTPSFSEGLDLRRVRRDLIDHGRSSWHRGRWWPGSGDPIPRKEMRYREVLAEAEKENDPDIINAIRVALGERYSLDRSLLRLRGRLRHSWLGKKFVPTIRMVRKFHSRRHTHILFRRTGRQDHI